ncbi:MAG TPA: hypothetical protein VK031_09090, partial [Tissierellaceae bacterium]|nr:hypothetical protein [Tissierellaceae bacterium]
MKTKGKLLIIIIIIITLLLMACGSEKEKAEVAKKDMAPNSLQEIHNDLVDILDKVGIIEKLNLGMTIPSEED